MIEEAKPFLTGIQDVAEWLIAVVAAVGLIVVGYKKASGPISGVLIRLGSRKTASRATSKARITYKPSFVLRLTVAVFTIFPWIMAMIYFWYHDFWPAALWFFGQGIFSLALNAAGKEPVGRLDVLQTAVCLFFCAMSLYMEHTFNYVSQIELRSAMAHEKYIQLLEQRDLSKVAYHTPVTVAEEALERLKLSAELNRTHRELNNADLFILKQLEKLHAENEKLKSEIQNQKK